MGLTANLATKVHVGSNPTTSSNFFLGTDMLFGDLFKGFFEGLVKLFVGMAIAIVGLIGVIVYLCFK